MGVKLVYCVYSVEDVKEGKMSMLRSFFSSYVMLRVALDYVNISVAYSYCGLSSEYYSICNRFTQRSVERGRSDAQKLQLRVRMCE